jgi:hypothetical protein
VERRVAESVVRRNRQAVGALLGQLGNSAGH